MNPCTLAERVAQRAQLVPDEKRPEPGTVISVSGNVTARPSETTIGKVQVTEVREAKPIRELRCTVVGTAVGTAVCWAMPDRAPSADA